jgi:lysophospholipase L1-like esterase
MQSIEDGGSETALPVYVIGDSHVLPYRNLLFREKWTGQWIIARSRYISGLTAHDLFKPDTGEFHPELIQFLEYEGLVRNGQATHLSMDETDFAIAKASGQSIKPPLVLFALGDIDIRGTIMPMLRDTHDFVPPFETQLPVLDRPLVPWALIEEAIGRRISPMIAGLRQLIESGFNRIYLQSLVPPTQNETRIKKLHGYDCPVSVRTKLVMAFNRHLEVECKQIGVTILDLWPRLTNGAYLRPDLEIDGVHLPPQAARWFVDALLEHAVNCQWLAVNHVRYELFYRMACGLDPFQSNRNVHSPS